MGEDPEWVAIAEERAVMTRRQQMALTFNVLTSIHGSLRDRIGGELIGKGLCVVDAFGILHQPVVKGKICPYNVLGGDVGNLQFFQVLLDIEKNHEIGTSAQPISPSLGPIQEELRCKFMSAGKRITKTVDWVHVPISRIYKELAANADFPSEVIGADAVLLNQCLSLMAAEETAAGTQAFLFSKNVIDSASVCKACVWRNSREESTPVFHPCLRKCDGVVGYCVKHVKKNESGSALPCGDWDPDNGHPSLPLAKRKEGLRRARLRWDAAMRRKDVAVCLKANAFVDVHGSNARHQRPYVSVAPESRGQLREWKPEAVPVAPFPCMLCDAGFATHQRWEQHVVTQHVSLQWYRQRLHYLTSRFDAVKPIGPQQWRFMVESFTEDFVSGSTS